MATPITGVEKLELAPIGVDGAMPTTGWVTIHDIADGSVSFTVPPIEKVKVRVEDVAGVRWILPGDTDNPVLAANTLDIDGANAEMLSGGDWDAVTSTYSAPAVEEIVYLAMRLTSKPYNGKKVIFSIPSAAISMGFSENLTRQGFLQMSIAGDVTTPVDGAGDPVSPWGFKVEAVV